MAETGFYFADESWHLAILGYHACWVPFGLLIAAAIVFFRKSRSV
jgi:hypothetical protein